MIIDETQGLSGMNLMKKVFIQVKNLGKKQVNNRKINLFKHKMHKVRHHCFTYQKQKLL